MKKSTYDSWSRALAFYMKLCGVGGCLFVPIFWAFTGRAELAFLPFFGAMAGVGQGLDILKDNLQLKRGEDDDSSVAP